FNELPYARQVALKFDTEHTELVINSRNFNNVSDLILEFGEPFADASMIPTYLMSREISRTEKVVLGGDGGDELFGGYHSYYFAHKFDKVKNFGIVSPFVNILSKIYPTYRVLFLKHLLKQTRLPKYFLLNRNFGFDNIALK
ncbi:MAG: asparagine synthase-related protein, partial [Candidatus Kapaibacterium sp.]